MKNSIKRLSNWKIPSTAEEWTQELRDPQENSSTSEKQNLEQPEPTDRYEIRFVKNPKKK